MRKTIFWTCASTLCAKICYSFTMQNDDDDSDDSDCCVFCVGAAFSAVMAACFGEARHAD